MKEKIKNLFLRFLFRMIDGVGSPVDMEDKAIQSWLANSAQDIGFIRYLEARDRQLIKAMAVDGFANAPRDSFVRKVGQRFELHAFHDKAKAARAAQLNRKPKN